MRSNANLTWYEKAPRTETYTRHEIYGVMWEDRRAENARSGMKADDITVYIPMAAGGEGIREGDLIVRDIVVDEITPEFTPTALKTKYPNRAARVKMVDRNDQGSPIMHHWQVGAA